MSEVMGGPMSERFEAVKDLVAGYGYDVRHQAGGQDGSDWEVTFSLPSMLHGQQAIMHHCAAPSEAALLSWLARWLPEQAAKEWRTQALILEGQAARSSAG